MSEFNKSETISKPHSIHLDPYNFESLFDNDFYQAIPNIYEGKCFESNPERPVLVVVTGVTGAGKDEITGQFIKDGILQRVTTATSRPRRHQGINPDLPVAEQQIIQADLDNLSGGIRSTLLEKLINEGKVIPEPGDRLDSYTWMRGRAPDEDEAAYHQNLKGEYKLVESNVYSGTLYGVPQESIVQATQVKGATPVVRVDINGAVTISEMLGGQLSILTVAILPDTWEQSREIFKTRSANTTDEEADSRWQKDKRDIRLCTDVVNFYIRSQRRENNEQGIVAAKNSFNQLLKTVLPKH